MAAFRARYAALHSLIEYLWMGGPLLFAFLLEHTRYRQFLPPPRAGTKPALLLLPWIFSKKNLSCLILLKDQSVAERAKNFGFEVDLQEFGVRIFRVLMLLVESIMNAGWAFKMPSPDRVLFV